MPLFVYIQFKAAVSATRIKAATVEEDDDNETLVVKDSNNKKVGEFKAKEVAGWWLQEEP